MNARLTVKNQSPVLVHLHGRECPSILPVKAGAAFRDMLLNRLKLALPQGPTPMNLSITVALGTVPTGHQRYSLREDM